MTPTVTYPVIFGETFSNQGIDICPIGIGEVADGAMKMIQGYNGNSGNPPASTLYNIYADGVIFRPWHYLNAVCPTPATLNTAYSPNK